MATLVITRCRKCGSDVERHEGEWEPDLDLCPRCRKEHKKAKVKHECPER